MHGRVVFRPGAAHVAAHKEYFLELYPPNEERLSEFAPEASESLLAQRRIEASDQGTFEEYLARYFATESKCNIRSSLTPFRSR